MSQPAPSGWHLTVGITGAGAAGAAGPRARDPGARPRVVGAGIACGPDNAAPAFWVAAALLDDKDAVDGRRERTGQQRAAARAASGRRVRRMSATTDRSSWSGPRSPVPSRHSRWPTPMLQGRRPAPPKAASSTTRLRMMLLRMPKPPSQRPPRATRYVFRSRHLRARANPYPRPGMFKRTYPIT